MTSVSFLVVVVVVFPSVLVEMETVSMETSSEASLSTLVVEPVEDWVTVVVVVTPSAFSTVVW